MQRAGCAEVPKGKHPGASEQGKGHRGCQWAKRSKQQSGQVGPCGSGKSLDFILQAKGSKSLKDLKLRPDGSRFTF